jgi:hypothetical protein
VEHLCENIKYFYRKKVSWHLSAQEKSSFNRQKKMVCKCLWCQEEEVKKKMKKEFKHFEKSEIYYLKISYPDLFNVFFNSIF